MTEEEKVREMTQSLIDAVNAHTKYYGQHTVLEGVSATINTGLQILNQSHIEQGIPCTTKDCLKIFKKCVDEIYEKL